VGSYLIDKLRQLAKKHLLIGDVRGLGLMAAVELVRDRTTKEPAIQERDALIQRCFHKGLLLLGCGANTVRFCPPLVINEHDVDSAVAIVDEVLAEVTGRQTPRS
jgi:4-aminobutyrate aminotransferase